MGDTARQSESEPHANCPGSQGALHTRWSYTVKGEHKLRRQAFQAKGTGATAQRWRAGCKWFDIDSVEEFQEQKVTPNREPVGRVES